MSLNREQVHQMTVDATECHILYTGLSTKLEQMRGKAILESIAYCLAPALVHYISDSVTLFDNFKGYLQQC